MPVSKKASAKRKTGPRTPVPGKKKARRTQNAERATRGSRYSEAKTKYRDMILLYYGDVDNPPVSRTELAEEVLGISRKTLYRHFAPDELADVEAEGLALRRARYASIASRVDGSLVKRALAGDVAAIKLFYQRIEHWSEKSTVAVEQNLDQIREYAIAKGYDPDEFIATFQEIKRKGASSE